MGQDWRPFNSRLWLGDYLLRHRATQPPETDTQTATKHTVEDNSAV